MSHSVVFWKITMLVKYTFALIAARPRNSLWVSTCGTQHVVVSVYVCTQFISPAKFVPKISIWNYVCIMYHYRAVSTVYTNAGFIFRILYSESVRDWRGNIRVKRFTAFCISCTNSRKAGWKCLCEKLTEDTMHLRCAFTSSSATGTFRFVRCQTTAVPSLYIRLN